MRIIISGHDAEPECYDRETREVELVIDLDIDDQDSPVTLSIHQDHVCVQRCDLVAAMKLL